MIEVVIMLRNQLGGRREEGHCWGREGVEWGMRREDDGRVLVVVVCDCLRRFQTLIL